MGVGDGPNLFLCQRQVFSVVWQIAGGTSAGPVLKTATNDGFVILRVRVAKSVRWFFRLLVTAQFLFDRVHLVLLIIEKARVMLLLGNLSEITSCAETHRDLPVSSSLVLVEWLNLRKSFPIDSFENWCVAIVDRVDLICPTILNWKRFLQCWDAGRNTKLLLAAHPAKSGRAVFTWRLAELGRVSGGGGRRLAYKVCMELAVPRCLRFATKANTGYISAFWLKWVTSC